MTSNIYKLKITPTFYLFVYLMYPYLMYPFILKLFVTKGKTIQSHKTVKALRELAHF